MFSLLILILGDGCCHLFPWISQCKETPTTATINCGAGGVYKTPFDGYFNLPQIPFAAIYSLNTNNHSAFKLGTLSYNSSNDLATNSFSDVTNSIVKAFNNGFSLTLDANVQSISNSIAAAVASVSEITMSNYMSVGFSNPQEIFNSSNNFATLTNFLSQAGTSHSLIIVSRVIAADYIQIQATNGTNGKIQVSVPKVGNFDVTINYNCSDIYQLSGKNAGIIYISPIKLNDGQVVVDTDSSVDLTGYNFSFGVY